MDLEQRLRASMVAPKPGPMFTAKVLARIARGATQRRSRFILVGTLLVVGAAASMLAWLNSDDQPPATLVAATSVMAATEPAARDALVQSAAEAQQPVAPVAQPSPTDTSPRFSVAVMPLQQEAKDANKRAAAQAFHAAMLDELRKVPGLALHVGESAMAGGGEPDYVLAFTSLDTTAVPSGGVLVHLADGSTRCMSTEGPERYCGVNLLDGQQPVSGIRSDTQSSAGSRMITFMRAEPVNYDDFAFVDMKLKSPGKSGQSGRTFHLLANGAAMPQRCSTLAGTLPTYCQTPAQAAASGVKALRLQRFPPDAAFHQRVIAQLASGEQPVEGGMTLQDLLSGLVSGVRAGSRMDAETIRALSRYLAGQPADTRASAWKMLSRASHPAMVAPLLESLRHDKDRRVRLAALENLAANYLADPDVRRACEEFSQNDPDLILRASMRQGLFGPEQRRTDALAALNDTGLPYEARLAPLLINVTKGVDINQEMSPQGLVWVQSIREPLLQDQQLLVPLLKLIREHLQDADHPKANSDILGLLAEIDDPAIFDMFLQFAREPSLPSNVSFHVRNWADKHRNDPRVPRTLPLRIASPELVAAVKKYVEETGQLPPGFRAEPGPVGADGAPIIQPTPLTR